MKNEIDAIRERHSVRNYLEKSIESEIIKILETEIHKANEKKGIHLQLITDNGDAFKSIIPAFGRFKGVRNYVAMVAKEEAAAYEACGYYGAKLAILAQQNGLNTCFVTSSYKKSGCCVSINPGEKLLGVIAIGYGKSQGKPHKSKELSKLGSGNSQWFLNGLKAVSFAPTALNKQNFYLEEKQSGVVAKPLDDKMNTLINLGIAKYHFEIGSGKDSSIWC